MIPDGARLKLQLFARQLGDPAASSSCSRSGGGVAPRRDAAHVQHGPRHAGLRPRRSRGRGDHAARALRASRSSSRRTGGAPADAPRRAGGVPHAMNVGVLVSGSGTNLQALIDASTRNELGPARLTVVGCNVPDCQALSRAPRWPGCRRSSSITGTTATRAAFDRRAGRGAARRTRSIWSCWPGSCGCSRASCSTPSPAGSSTSTLPCLPAFPGVHAQRQALRRRRQDRRLHRSLRRPRRRHRPDHRAGRRAASRTMTTTRRCGRASWPRSTACCRRWCARSPSGAWSSRGGACASSARRPGTSPCVACKDPAAWSTRTSTTSSSVGASRPGLVAAALLARRGFRVLVVGRRARAGGVRRRRQRRFRGRRRCCRRSTIRRRRACSRSWTASRWSSGARWPRPSVRLAVGKQRLDLGADSAAARQGARRARSARRRRR